jgi:hypothetical protein
MTKNHAKGIRRRDRSREAGQATLFLILALGIFLLGALCFAFDMSNMWFHRQAAQTAADAACTAGAMDLLVDSQGGATGYQGFTAGTNYSCTASSTDSVCQYAAKNGYNSNNTSPGNAVNVSFPASVIGVTTPPAGIAPNPLIRVDVVDHVQTFFLGLFSGGTSKDVRAFATCGVELATSPIPIVVLDPQNPGTTAALSVQGTPAITIVGGPARSIQVDSGASNATNIGGAGTIDLSKGGPNGTGSDIGIYGGPATAPGGFNGGTTGHWISPAAPINDPFAQVVTPAAGTARAAPNVVPDGQHGCQNPGSSCYEYLPGSYAGGICVGKPCTYKIYTSAIFQGGVYLVNGFVADANSCLRMSTVDTPGIGGAMFYFTGGGSVSVNSNSGSKCPVAFDTLNTLGVYNGMLTYGVKCTATSQIIPPGLIPASLTGNVMLGPCSGTYGDPLGAADPLGVQRGILFFQDRSVLSANQSWGGGGSFLLAGTMYFHSCNAAGTGTGCGAAGTYLNDSFTLSGGSGSSTYVLGDIIADNIALGGNSAITMDLNSTKAFTILKASLLQ